jgi:hypothetical protein
MPFSQISLYLNHTIKYKPLIGHYLRVLEEREREGERGREGERERS